MSIRWNLVTLVAVALTVLTPVHAQDDGEDEAGDRILAIDVSEAEGEEFHDAFLLACEIGLESIGLSLDWTDIETAPGEYDGSILEIANLYYPLMGMPVDFTIRPLHTNTLRVPDDLAGLPLDDPQMVERFLALLDFIFSMTPAVTYNSFIIGSEFDVYLGTDADLWAQYTALAVAGRDYVKAHDESIPVAFEMIYGGLLGDAAEAAAALNAYADVIGVSYYPLDGFAVEPPDAVHETFDRVIAAYPDKPIYFYQFGYPSSDENASSEAMQAEFIRQTFEAWDRTAEHIIMIDFTWLTEMSDETVAYFEDYYSFSAPGFAAFLGSLGLRHRDGTPKLALDALRAEAAARGWASICQTDWIEGG
ncbi:MAG: hypothetical protein ACOCXZ_01540 [Chloroflexota bacterium]